MGAATSKDEDLESDSFSEVDGDDCGDEDLMPRNEELEEAILSEFVEALIDVAPPTWPPAKPTEGRHVRGEGSACETRARHDAVATRSSAIERRSGGE